MTEPTKPTPEQEALSRFLDELNKGQSPETDDAEEKELLETAALLRRAALPVAPPKHLTEAIIREGCAQQEKITPATTPPPSQHWSRRWFYSGLVGTAASVLLAVGLQLSPMTAPISAPPTLPAATPDIMPDKMPPASGQPFSPSAAKTRASSPAAPAQEGPHPVATTREPTVSSMPPAAVKKPQATTSTPTSDAFNNLSVPIVERDAAVALKSAKYSVAAVLPKEAAQELAPLILPGHPPDSITRDEKTGVITQHFYSNTLKKMTLTQEPLNGALNREEATATDATGLTTVVRIRFEQRLSLTGRQSEPELLALIDTLQKQL